MEKRNISLNKYIYPVVFLAFLQGCSAYRSSAKQDQGIVKPEYYAAGDFTSVEKIDSHIHFNVTDSAFTEQSVKDNFRLLNIVDDRPFGPTWEELQGIALRQVQLWPGKVCFATTIPVSNWNNDNWVNETVTLLKDAISKGAIAVKIWKNVGMDLRNRNGKFVMIDDPRFDPVFDFLAANNITLIGHNGEPRDCWLPVEQMTVKGNRNYYSQHPEYHMYLHPEYPSYKDQIRARDNMLRKHPDLKFIGAHLGSLEWSLDELAKRLDKFPNMAVDLSRMANLQIHTLTNWQKTHDFFIKYQDRLIYGTDRTVSRTGNTGEFKRNVHESWLQQWKFYATGDIITAHEGEGELHGLMLPKEVIDKIFRKNAEKWLPGQSYY